jgi:sugar phosphate isomerase/epimerase
MISRRRFLTQTGIIVPAVATALQGAGTNSATGTIDAEARSSQAGVDKPVVGYMVYGGPGEHKGIPDQIAGLRDKGFLGVGFHSEPPLAPQRSFDPFTASPQEVKRLQSILSSFKRVEVHGPYSDWDISLVSPNPAIRKASLADLERHIDFAESVGASVFTAHPGKTSVPSPVNERLERLTDSLHALAEMAEKRRFLVCVETSDILINTSHLRVFDAVKSDYLGNTMDTGHISFHWPGEKEVGYAPYGSIEGFIKAWGKRIRHVHVNDYNSKRDHIGVGQGQLPLRGVLTALHSVGYRGFLDMEVDPTVVPAQEAPEERDLVEKLIDEIWSSPA